MLDIPQEKQVIINAIRAKNNVCVIGAAGTGKSFLLKLIREHFPYIHITASTGVAAVNVAGVTIHSWAGIGNCSLPMEKIVEFINSGKGTKIRRQIKKAKLLAIDEISMISAQTFNLLDQVFQRVRESDQAFGGIQIMVLGDFFQLPPISANKEIDFCFSSDAWEMGGFQVYELTEIFRQQDLEFIQLLNNIRHASLNQQDIDLLKQREIISQSQEFDPTILVTHNFQADKINKDKLLSLSSDGEVIYKMNEAGKDTAINFLKKNCLAQEELVLRVGAQVMMLKNTLQKQGIINGSIGIIIGFSKNQLPIVRFHNDKTCIISAEDWNVEAFNDITQTKDVLGSISQIPLSLAWAITIHKSQGMTLDSILCDLSHVFAEGQAYVALSRVKSLEGLYIKGFKPALLKVNPQVREFYNNLNR